MPDQSNYHPRFVIRSAFGKAREPRSRKNRPCDMCRRRKTACVIATEPPCQFCRGRGLDCQSAGRAVPAPRDSDVRKPEESTNSPWGHHPFPSPASHSTLADLSFDRSLPLPRAENASHGRLSNDTGSPRQDANHSRTSFELAPRRNEIGAFKSLEDTGDRTAHSVGLAAEQDAYLLDSFRSALLSEQDEVDAKFVQVFPGSHNPDDHPIHFLLLHNLFPSHANHTVKVASETIENLVSPYGPALIRLYFKHVHPILPVVSKGRFLRQYAEDKSLIPASLRGAVYALACVYWDQDTVLGIYRPFEQHELVDHAHSSLRRELEAPNLFKLQACLLLMHVMPPEWDSVESPSLWIMASQATACAQMIGLHQDPTHWNIAPWEKKMRKRLWWATYVADCWASVCHGNPSHIAPGSFNTSALLIDDMNCDESIDEHLFDYLCAKDVGFDITSGARFVETVNIAQHLRAVLDYSCSISATAETRLRLLEIQEKLRRWKSLVPSCLIECQHAQNGPLHLSFYTTQALLFRGLMHPATHVAKASPDSRLRKWLSAALTAFDGFVAFFDQISDTHITCFWGRAARSQLILCGNFLIYLFLLASEPHDVAAAYHLLETFHRSLQRRRSPEDARVSLLLRPAALRIDSFFSQASEIMKSGAQGSIRSVQTMT